MNDIHLKVRLVTDIIFQRSIKICQQKFPKLPVQIKVALTYPSFTSSPDSTTTSTILFLEGLTALSLSKMKWEIRSIPNPNPPSDTTAFLPHILVKFLIFANSY